MSIQGSSGHTTRRVRGYKYKLSIWLEPQFEVADLSLYSIPQLLYLIINSAFILSYSCNMPSKQSLNPENMDAYLAQALAELEGNTDAQRFLAVRL